MKKISILVMSVLSILGANLYADEIIAIVPRETAIFQLSDHKESEWKEISRYVSVKEGLVEVIPLNQTIQNWSDLIGVQYISLQGKSVYSLEVVLEAIRKESLATYPKDKTCWQIIEKSKEGIIYEWVHKSYNDVPIQHEINRAFLTPSGFHRIGFTKRNRDISAEERAKWIRLLRENSSVVSFKDGECIEGFSMVEKLQNSVLLETHFRDWQISNCFSVESGCSLVCRIPPDQGKTYITECLEIFTRPNITLDLLNNFFEKEKACIQKKTFKRVIFHILEQSPSEIIYYYCHPQDHLQLNGVVRTFLTDRGYYSLSYKKGLEHQMQKEEILPWIEKLKTIQVEVPSKSIKATVYTQTP